MANHPTRPEIRLTEGAFYANDPDPHYAWMRANAPVYWDESGHVWGITRYADLKRISKDPATFSNAGGIRPGFGPIPMMIDMDDPDHWNRRKLVNRGFTPRRVRDQEAKIHDACDYILDRTCAQGAADLVADIAAPLPMIMIGDSLGVAPEDRDDLLRWSDEIAKRRAEPTDDLMSTLVNAEVDGDKLADDEIIHESLLILIGGDETTRHVISEGVYQLLLHPDQWQKLRGDRGLLDSAVEELLRWVSPIKNMARTVTHDVEVGGQQMTAGEELLLLYASANRDESAFDHPERFDVERSPNDHVAFGFGSHFCLGNSLARLEIKVMLDHLLTRLPDLALDLADGQRPPFRPANFIVGPEALPVTFTPSDRVGASA
jgi:cytochrome P450 family 142 subfamily A polypeptide 1